VQRASFGMLSSYALTVAGTRLVNYVRERRRPAPIARSLARRMYDALSDDSPRVHHFVPGIGLALVTGAAAILSHDDDLAAWLSVPFGSGVALTMDEIALLVGHRKAYWSSESLALAQSAAAGLASIVLAARFAHKGMANEDESA
jgi:hypothetical protein